MVQALNNQSLTKSFYTNCWNRTTLWTPKKFSAEAQEVNILPVRCLDKYRSLLLLIESSVWTSLWNTIKFWSSQEYRVMHLKMSNFPWALTDRSSLVQSSFHVMDRLSTESKIIIIKWYRHRVDMEPVSKVFFYELTKSIICWLNIYLVNK